MEERGIVGQVILAPVIADRRQGWRWTMDNRYAMVGMDDRYEPPWENEQ
jgi:hypothetical protein